VAIRDQQEEAEDEEQEAEAELLRWINQPASSISQVVLEGPEGAVVLLREEAAEVLLREEEAVVALLREEAAEVRLREEAVVVLLREEVVVGLKEADEEVLLEDVEALLVVTRHVACHNRRRLPNLKSRRCMTMTLRLTTSCPSRKEMSSPSSRRIQEVGGKESWAASEDGCLPTMSRSKLVPTLSSRALTHVG